jgi:hypothetical protein
MWIGSWAERNLPATAAWREAARAEEAAQPAETKKSLEDGMIVVIYVGGFG